MVNAAMRDARYVVQYSLLSGLFIMLFIGLAPDQGAYLYIYPGSGLYMVSCYSKPTAVVVTAHSRTKLVSYIFMSCWES